MEYGSLRDFVDRHERLLVLTGAGCSTESGIPDYRDDDGGWKRNRPIMYRDFMAHAQMRRRYWARSLVGWRRFSRAAANDTHRALAALEHDGRLELLVTQNVDRLHQAAGSRRVLDLHGRLDRVRCTGCGRESAREALQGVLLQRNAEWASHDAGEAPDGDADLDHADFSGFDVPDCAACGGILKPDVVFFGESVPRARVETAMAAAERADAMLVVGSSLMVYSGFRFARTMAAAAKQIAAVNLGRTRADDLLALKVTEPCSRALAFLLGGKRDKTGKGV